MGLERQLKVREGKEGSSWLCRGRKVWSQPPGLPSVLPSLGLVRPQGGRAGGGSGAPSADQLLCTPAPGGALAPGGTQPIRIEPSSSHVAEGQTLDLNCVVPGQAHAQVTWYKRGGSLPARHQVKQGPPPPPPLHPGPQASLREGLAGRSGSSPLLTLPGCAQTHGSLLRLHRVSPADSGEYVCRVILGSGPLETSVLVSIEASDAGTIPGEWTISDRLAGP